MIPAALSYLRPATVAEAVSALAEYGEDARPLAGGQSLIPMLRLRLATPAVLIDLAGIPDLTNITAGPATITVGAMATHRQVATSDQLASLHLFADAAQHLGDVQVRNQGTFAGALAHADPAGDWPAVAIAADATLHVTGSGGQRRLPADQFFAFAYTTDLRPGELLTAVEVPAPPAERVSAYVKIAHGASGYALAGVAAVLDVVDHRITNARIAVTGTAATPTRLPGAEAVLIGAPPEPEVITAAAEACVRDLAPISDNAASGEYRLHLTSIACQRALSRAASRPPPSPARTA